MKKKRHAQAQASAQYSDVSVCVIESDNGKKRLDVDDLPNGKQWSKAKTKKSSSQNKSLLRKTCSTDKVEIMA
jgi:hypothetical protein